MVTKVGPAVLRDHGGDGPPAILVPSLINPPHVLDLDEEVSLASAVARMGRRSLLLDWGAARERADLDVGGHVANLLVPLIEQLEQPPALIGYCLGGTMAIARRQHDAGRACRDGRGAVALLGLSRRIREPSLQDLWRSAKAAAASLKVLPMEVLQAAFWSLDPSRTVSKFASFAALEPGSDEVRRFVILEDWANEGEALPLPAARELIEDFFGADLPGSGRWTVGGRPMTDAISVPLLNCTSSKDRITPAQSAPHGEVVEIAAGHVGMVVGSARSRLHEALAAFLDPACRSRHLTANDRRTHP